MFTPDDTEAAIEYFKEQAALCSGCGLPRDETMDPANENAYEAKPVRCHACKARGHASKEFTKGPHDDAGLYFSVEKVGGGHLR